MRKFFQTALLPVLALVALTSCTEVEFASHVTKRAMGTTTSSEPQSAASASTPSAQSGTFKVGNPYNIDGRTYHPRETYNHTESGIASWYGPGFHGKKTANGEIFDRRELTAAHRTLQMPSLVRVTNLENGKSVIVRINDRGPFARGRVIDVSERVAELLEFKNQGTARVRLDVLPQESLQVAEMARRGESTRGTEIAANQGRMPMPEPASAYQTASADSRTVGSAIGPGPVSRDYLDAPAVPPGHHTQDGRFMPDPVVTQMEVKPSAIYVQVGSFTVHDNAARLRQSLESLGPTKISEAFVKGQTFYRVRAGPARTVPDADRLLAQVVKMGHTGAIIVVD